MQLYKSLFAHAVTEGQSSAAVKATDHDKEERLDNAGQGTKEQRAGPLAGLLVIDFSRVIAGPYAAQLLGDLGADVIKVEEPGAGDPSRKNPPHTMTF